MEKFLIFTDVSADVDLELVNNENIGLIPMEFAFDNETFTFSRKNGDGELKEFYDNLRNGKKPVTSQITPYAYEEIFTPYLESGNSILYISLSSGLSSTYSSACIASNNLNIKFKGSKLVVVDSLFATVAIGVMLEKACELRSKNLTIDQVKTQLEEYSKHLYCACFVDDLMHLKRGGRISGTKAAIGTLFGIKPIVAFNGTGKLDVTDKKKGARLAVSYLANKYQEIGNMDATTSVYVADSDNKEIANFAIQKILAINPNAVIKHVGMSPIIGTHLGPDSAVIAFETK